MKPPTSPTPSVNQFLNISRNVSPLPMPGTCRSSCMSASNKTYRFFSRIWKVNHMDFQSALSQMVNLFIGPQKIFKQANYRKRKDHHNIGARWIDNRTMILIFISQFADTKSQYARDDPAFLVLLVISLCRE